MQQNCSGTCNTAKSCTKCSQNNCNVDIEKNDLKYLDRQVICKTTIKRLSYQIFLQKTKKSNWLLCQINNGKHFRKVFSPNRKYF